MAAPRLTPSSWNWTELTPTLSVALAETVMVPLTVDPPAGAVNETTDGAVSTLVAGPVTVNSSMMSSETLYPPNVWYSYAPKSNTEAADQLAVGVVYVVDFASAPFK